jgi:signal transduction histidine kinase
LSSQGYFTDLIRRHWKFIVIILVFQVLTLFLITNEVKGFPIPELEKSYPIFILSFLAFVLIMFISGSLFYRWSKWGKHLNLSYHLSWGISYLLFSIVFVGLMLESFGFEFANSQNPEIFFIFRQGMIFWAAGMWYGFGEILFSVHQQKKLLQIIPALYIILISELWFIYGLLIVSNIEFTMYGFLFSTFIPVSFTIAYMWYVFGFKRYILTGYSKRAVFYLIIGFVWFGITYAAWSPWHFADVQYVYAIWFGLFLIALTLMLIGFMMLPYGQSQSETFPKFATYEMTIDKSPVINKDNDDLQHDRIPKEYQKFLEYTSFISHELKNPLITVSGFLNLITKELKGKKENQKLTTYLKRIENNNKQALLLLDDLAQLRKFETHTIVMKPETYQFFEHVQETVNSFRQEYKDITFEVDVPSDINCFLDKSRIEQVIKNIIINAKKYIAPTEGIISIKGNFVEKTQMITLTFEDNGPGIPDSIKDNLFQKYVSADTVFGSKGSGIGLYLSRLIVEHHGGKMMGESSTKYDEGALFEISLPQRIIDKTRFQLLKLF